PQNVKLLDQFICPHSGVIFHPTHTGEGPPLGALGAPIVAPVGGAPGGPMGAGDPPNCLYCPTGLLWLQVPYVPAPREDFSNQHQAVSKTPPAPALAPGRHWYPWYERRTPPADAIARVRRLYKDYLKKEEDVEVPPAPETPPAEQKKE
ncbi:PREDICTED: 28S ribosomal protein S18b, mitochondrial, partial [Calidris pugnax]|uniref:28S ribosomal protein S18b, mitochondrial n=1 Tax=Calidris pugnax TaxID=198806 RepID=UPI00071E4CD6